MRKLSYSRYKWVCILTSILSVMVFAQCTSEEALLENDEVRIMANVAQVDEVQTRAIVLNPINPNDYRNENFYIYSKSNVNEVLAIYRVASGLLGQLTSQTEEGKLLWFNRETKHTFSGWTMPWGEDTYKLGDNPKTTIWFLQEEYEKLFPDERNTYFNCRLLERFIGAKTEPLSYYSNGEMVRMDFQHLVSKIHINEVTFIDQEGTETAGVGATMTFYQLPRWAIFDRMPEDGGAPRVIQDPKAELGVSCSVGTPTTLYVCPEVDFADMKFSIHVNKADGNKVDFYGDFKSVLFQREDTEQPEWDKGKSQTVLYAGEEMTINLVLRDGNSGGFVTVNIGKWSDQKFRDATSYPRNGIYTDSELLRMYDYFSKAYSKEAFDEFFEMYGQEIDGEKVVCMYEDCITSHTRMPMPQEAVVDGTGHTLTIKTESHPEYAQVGCCRNIFISDGKGHTIYIDENYNTYIVDEDTLEMTPTGFQLDPAPLTGDLYSYRLYYEDYTDPTTGTVYKAGQAAAQRTH